jgi:dTDP-4-amino-4,6-dideoxygalactose transaminase
MIPYSKPYISLKNKEDVSSSLSESKLSGDGIWTRKATSELDRIFSSKTLLTTSCTDAIEMSSILLNIGPGDEVIVPSYTFVSTVLPFESRGAKIIFVDSEDDRPHLDINSALKYINKNTKVIIPVHYAGESVDMAELKSIDSSVKIIEDNAQGIFSKYLNEPLGSIGTFGTLSFHDTKNIVCGEGGALIINDSDFLNRAEIIREKGTNRSSFFRGEVDKYGWVDIGSSFLPSDILAALLYSQLMESNFIQEKKLLIYNKYLNELNHLDNIGILTPKIRNFSTGNGHIYYIVCRSYDERVSFINFMKDNGIYCVSHYISLHSSKYFKNKYDKEPLKNSDRFSDCLVRLPTFVDLTESDQSYIIDTVNKFYKKLDNKI